MLYAYTCRTACLLVRRLQTELRMLVGLACHARVAAGVAR